MNETVVQNEQLRRYVETHHIDMIPAGARHGKPWQQAAFWAGANINVFNVVLGGVVVSIGLTFWWAFIAIVAGTLAGALFIALHATQGPRLGVPQTIQSRGQFGFYGAAFLFPCVLLLNVGFIAAQLVIQAQSAQGVIGSVSIPEWILILAVPAAIIGIFGYRWIHRVMQVTIVVVGLSMIIMLIQGLRYGSLPAKETTMTAPTVGLFLAGAALLVILTLSLINSDTLNAYTGAFQVLALGNMWRRFKSVSVMLRVVPFLCVMAVGVLIALLGYKHFVSNLSNFLDVLLVIFIPWSAVNLTDYFLVRRGNYDVTAFFIPDGVYGKISWRGLVAYAAGLAAEWPFVSQPDYVGPLVSHLGGADVSWLVGFFVSAVVYLILVVSSAPETGRHDRQVAATGRWR